MPSKPSQPHTPLKPAVVNVKQLAVVGSAAWILALAVLGVRLLLKLPVDSTHIWICLTGLALGALGFWWAHYRHLIDDDGIAALPDIVESPAIHHPELPATQVEE